MANRTRGIDDARRAWRRRRVEIGDDLRTHRRLNGARQADVAEAIGVSASEISRREHGLSTYLSVESLVEHAAAVGLRVSLSTYPAGGAVRDAGQLRVTHRLLDRIGDGFAVELEAPVPTPGDLRAVDVLLRAPGCSIAVEVITRLADLQSQLRAARLKARDIGATRLIVVVAGTHANRRVLDDVRPSLVGSWELDTRRVLAMLSAGLQPDRDALIVI